MPSETRSARQSARLYLSVLAVAAAGCLASLQGYGRSFPYFLAAILYFLVIAALSRPNQRRVILALLWASAAAALLAILQVPFTDRPPGPFASPNFLGAFCAVALFLAWHFRAYYIAVADLVAIGVSQSRGAILAAGVGAIMLLWRRSRPGAVALAGMALGATLALHPGPEARIGIWHTGILAFLHQPVLGYGIGLPWTPALDTLIDHWYSIPLDWLLNTGLVGAAAGLWLLAETWGAARPYPALRAALAAWLVQGLFISAIPATSALFLAMAAWLSSEGREEQLVAVVIDDDQPALHGGMRAGRAD